MADRTKPTSPKFQDVIKEKAEEVKDEGYYSKLVRRYLWENEPEIARKWADEKKARGGLIKKAMTNQFAKQGSLQDFAAMRSGGLIRNGSLTPGSVEKASELSKKKFRDN